MGVTSFRDEPGRQLDELLHVLACPGAQGTAPTELLVQRGGLVEPEVAAPLLSPHVAWLYSAAEQLREFFGCAMVTASLATPLADGSPGTLLPRLQVGADTPERARFMSLANRLTRERSASSYVRRLHRAVNRPMTVAVARRSELIDDDHWNDSFWYWDMYRPAALHDMMLSIYRPADGQPSALLALIRDDNTERFNEVDRERFRIVCERFAARLSLGIAMAPPVPEPAAERAAATARAEWETRVGQLSKTVRAVLDLLLKGMTEEEAARRLCRSPHTVHSHAKTAYRTLGVHSRVELLQRYTAAGGSNTIPVVAS